MLKSVVDRLFYEKNGQILVSAIFGLAIALMFHRVCKDNCIVFYAPHINEITDREFNLEGTCYKYKPYNVKCNSNDKIIDSYNINTKPDNKLEDPNSFLSKIF